MKRAAVYIRMSTDDQTGSPERQRSLVLPYCERKGYRVVEVYEDLGLRGWDDDRPGFQRLMKDARSGRFDVIVVDEQSRLCRNDPIEFAATVGYPLRQAGVALELVDQGQQITWDGNDLGGLLVGFIGQYKVSQESITLGRRTLGGMTRRAREGKMFPGRAPFGYKYKIEDGKRFGYEPCDPEQVRIVKYIFDAYLNRDLSLMAVVADLNSRQIRTPMDCGRWGKTTVHNILTNHAYAGSYVWGKVPQGKYYRCDGGEILPAGPHPRKLKKKWSERLPSDRWVIIPGTHAPLVEPALFDKVQERLAANRVRTSPSRTKNSYPLSQLLVCSHCGTPLYGTKVKSGRRQVVVYRCGSNMSNGSCAPRTVWESVIMEKLAEVLQEKFLDPRNLERVRASLRRQQVQQADQTHDVAEDLRQKLDRLDGQVAKARKNLILLDPEDIPDAKGQIREWERERADAQAQLDRLAKQPPADDLEHLVAKVGRLVEVLRSAAPEAVRALMREVVGQVDLRFETVRKAKVTRYPLAGGVVHFLECGGSSSSGPAAARRCGPCSARPAWGRTCTGGGRRRGSRTGRGSSPPPARSGPGTSSRSAPGRWSPCPAPAAGAAPPGCGGGTPAARRGTRRRGGHFLY